MRVTARAGDVDDIERVIDACLSCLTRSNTTPTAQRAVAVILATLINTHEDVSNASFVALVEDKVPALVKRVGGDNDIGVAMAIVWCTKAAMVS